MKERPILFSGPMVRALLDGSKTQTRRVVMPQPKHPLLKGVLALDDEGIELYLHDRTLHRAVRCPYGKPGDRLWVREAWSKDCDPHWIMYRADGIAQRRTGGEVFDECAAEELNPNAKWKPSIHMPRWASRITLEVTEVRVERLQDITEADARAEGAPGYEDNIAEIQREAGRAAAVLLAWGALADRCPDWFDLVIEEIECAVQPGTPIYCLGKTAGGYPKHPLARGKHKVPKDAPLIPWRTQ